MSVKKKVEEQNNQDTIVNGFNHNNVNLNDSLVEANFFELFDETNQDNEYLHDKTSENNNQSETKMTVKKLTVENIVPSCSKAVTRQNGVEGVVTFVDGGKCGRRIVINKKIYTRLELTDTIQVGFIPEGILFGKSIPGQTNSFKLKEQGAKYIIYSTNLVKECTEKLHLEFESESKTSITFHNVEFDDTLGDLIAIVSR
jgi:glycogen debranching enzyme